MRLCVGNSALSKKTTKKKVFQCARGRVKGSIGPNNPTFLRRVSQVQSRVSWGVLPSCMAVSASRMSGRVSARAVGCARATRPRSRARDRRRSALIKSFRRRFRLAIGYVKFFGQTEKYTPTCYRGCSERVCEEIEKTACEDSLKTENTRNGPHPSPYQTSATTKRHTHRQTPSDMEDVVNIHIEGFEAEPRRLRIRVRHGGSFDRGRLLDIFDAADISYTSRDASEHGVMTVSFGWNASFERAVGVLETILYLT